MKIKKQIEQIEGVELVEKADKGVLLVYLKQKLSNKDLLEIAKAKYPVGTKFVDMESGAVRTVSGEDHYVGDHNGINCSHTPSMEWEGLPASSNPYLFLHGQWAEIVLPLFKTEDGVDVYEGDVFYVVDTELLSFKQWDTQATPPMPDLKKIQFVAHKSTPFPKFSQSYFSSEEKAQAYIDAHKPLELVEGEIYTSKEDKNVWIFRFHAKMPDRSDNKKRAASFSLVDHYKKFIPSGLICYKDSERVCAPSSLEEKKQLITAEVNNGYFHGL